MNSDYFQFKKFILRNTESTLKINTDGVLIGAWCNTEGSNTILDIGTGCGLIAFMLSQKVPEARIWGIDIEPKCIAEASHNLGLNNFSNIKFSVADIRAYATKKDMHFDYVISNPPFYLEETSDSNNAKHTKDLSFKELVEAYDRLMHSSSKGAMILPYQHLALLEDLLKSRHLYLNRLCLVSGKSKLIPNRVMIEFSRSKAFLETSYLSVRSDNNEYSKEHRMLTKDFYLPKTAT